MYDLIQVNSIKAYEAFQYMGVKPSKANINSWGGGGGGIAKLTYTQAKTARKI